MSIQNVEDGWIPICYFDSQPIHVEIFCAPGFRLETGHLATALGTEYVCHFANINVLIERLARGVRLSKDSFAPEDIGFAFKSGSIRFYGVFSDLSPRAFVLSHSVHKTWPKLRKADIKVMARCKDKFDSWRQSQNSTRRNHIG